MIDADDVITDFLAAKAQSLEQQILEKGELLDIFMNLQKVDQDGIVSDQLAMITTDLDRMIDELLSIRKKSEFTTSNVQGVIDRMGKIKPISHEKLAERMRSKYLWESE